VTDGGFGCAAVTSVILGSVTMVVSDAFCGSGYMLAGALSCVSFFLVRTLRVARDLSEAVEQIELENAELRASNQRYSTENEKLTQSNIILQGISNELDEDIEILTNSMKTAGENRQDFMSKLRTVHKALKQENDRHCELNVQQGKLQLLQLFQHFDQNSNLLLDEKEVKSSISFLTQMFPTLNITELLECSKGDGITYQQFQSRLL
jgi:septal ring factor EnvC (AmiA/AmiB activator)